MITPDSWRVAHSSPGWMKRVSPCGVSSSCRAQCSPSQSLFSFEPGVVGRDALRLLVDVDPDLPVLRVRPPNVPIQHMLAFILVAIGRRPLWPLGEWVIHVALGWSRLVGGTINYQPRAQARRRGGGSFFAFVAFSLEDTSRSFAISMALRKESSASGLANRDRAAK